MDENRNDDNVVIPERAHDQPAEGGREQAAAASADGPPDPEAEGIVDQQGAALQAMADAPDNAAD
jgi:hypothetical protein